MTKRTLPLLVATAALALAAATARAESFEVSLGLEPGGALSEYDGFDLDAGVFLGVGVPITADWKGELRLLAHDGDRLDVNTWQLGARTYFPTGVEWKPFAQGGLHYATRDYHPQGNFADRDDDGDFGVFAGGGVDWNATPRFALRFDGRLALYDSDFSGGLETDVDLTAGAVFRF